MIREASLSDIDALVALGEFFAPKAGAARFSEKMFRPEIRKIIKSPHAIVLVAEHEGSIVGALVGQICKVWYSEDLYATDLAFVVRPEYSGYYAWLMAKRFVRWARSESRVVEVTMQVSSGMESADRTGAMYQALGMSRVGGCYTLNFQRKAP